MFIARPSLSLGSMVERRATRDRRAHVRDLEAQVMALGKGFAVAAFSADGRLQDANEAFLEVMGYRIDDVRGKHHSMFTDAATSAGPDYRAFWDRLSKGEPQSGEFRRQARDGRALWLQASYVPVPEADGSVARVIAHALDVTAQKQRQTELEGQVSAIGKSQAVIEFNLDGTIIAANANFLATVGYGLEEIRGQHHGMFVDPAYRQTPEYRMFWDKLARGEYDGGQYRRLAKGGREIWLQASYNPIFDTAGKPFKVVKYAADITAQKLQTSDLQGQLDAIGKSQAVIEFGLDGRIQMANENFLGTVGYGLDEIRGQHHSMFVDPMERQSNEYRLFWEKLGRGEYDAGQYRRMAKGGRELWLQASYNPIFDASGKPFKVVKYASDITAQKLQAADFSGQLAAIDKAQAVIEFNLDGRIQRANENFLAAVGYSMDEIRGQHHSMFVDPSQRQGMAYRMFWEKLARGEYDSGQYKRVAKGGRELWLQASYNPILDTSGKPFKVVKYATDITEQVHAAAVLREAVAQIRGVVTKAQANDLSDRIPMEGKSGDIGDLCAGVNGMMDTMAGWAIRICPSARRNRPPACLRSGSEGRPGGDGCGAHDGGHQRRQPQDRRYHRRDRRDRLPDQHPGAERRGGGSTGRRSGPWLCRGGGGGAQPGAAQRQCREGDQGADFRICRQSGIRLAARHLRRADDGRNRAFGEARDRHHGRNFRCLEGAEQRHRGSEYRRHADGQDHPAKCRAG